MTTEEQTSASRDRHSVILDYLRTVPGVLGGFAGLIGAVTALLTLIK